MIIDVFRIDKTTYEDDTSWVHYSIKDDKGEKDLYLGYEIINDLDNDCNDTDKLIESFNTLFNEDKEAYAKVVDKPILEKVCSTELKDLIEETVSSDNEMWYVDEGEMEPDLVESIKNEVKKLNIQDWFIFNSEDTLITIYGGVITKFLFTI